MSKLSKENYDKLNENYLYQCEPVINNSFYVGSTPATYHCKNWTFKVHKYDDGRVYMFDTYFDSWDGHNFLLTDENIDNFKFVFDFREVKRIYDDQTDEYNEEDVYRVATNSSGYSCGHLYWIKKDTEKSKQLLIDKKQREVNSLERDLKWAKESLENLLKGDC